MKISVSGMCRGCAKSAVLFFSLGICWSAFSMKKESPVSDFANHMDYCYYMVAPPGGVQDELESRYSIALEKALSFLQKKQRDVTMLDALIVLRSECGAKIIAMAKFER